VDDFTMTFGRHTFKAGINWRKNDVADFDYGQFTSGLVLEGSLNNFFNGGAAPGGFDLLEQKFLTASSEPMFLWNMGIYGQDEFRIGRNLKITAALRIDHNANPQCNTNCFSQFAVPFTELDHDPRFLTIRRSKPICTRLTTAPIKWSGSRAWASPGAPMRRP
jgi:outer membrane receptor protein involved in Fe transport